MSIGGGVLSAIARAFSPFNAFVCLTIENAKVIEGIAYGICRRLTFTSSQTIDIILDPTAFTGSNLILLPIGLDGIGGPLHIDIYRGATANDDGTLVNPPNHKHTITDPGEVIFHIAPTGIVPGSDKLGELIVPSDGAGVASSSGANTSETLVCELDPTKKYLFRITNTDGTGGATLGLKLDYFEVPSA